MQNFHIKFIKKKFKILIMYKILSLLFLLFYFPLNAKLVETKSPKALCSNGEQATFTFFEGKSNNWLMYIQGGGVAAQSFWIFCFN